jgi:1,4-dihydroxy-2-naphthoate octaprenyltransferase
MTPKQIALISLALIVVGCLIAAIFSPVWLDVVGITVGGIGLVGIISAAFYAVGQSEDRQREKDGRGSRNGPPPSV